MFHSYIYLKIKFKKTKIYVLVIYHIEGILMALLFEFSSKTLVYNMKIILWAFVLLLKNQCEGFCPVGFCPSSVSYDS